MSGEMGAGNLRKVRRSKTGARVLLAGGMTWVAKDQTKFVPGQTVRCLFAGGDRLLVRSTDDADTFEVWIELGTA